MPRSTWEAVAAQLSLLLWSHAQLSGSTSSAAATLLLFQLGLLTPGCASALQSVSCSADGCPAASGCSAVTAAADPLTPLLFPAQPVLPNVGEETPLGRSRFLCPVLQNEGGNTEGCLLSNSPSEHTAIYIAREKVFAGTTVSHLCRQDNVPFVPVCNSHFARPPWKMLPLSGLGRNSSRVI